MKHAVFASALALAVAGGWAMPAAAQSAESLSVQQELAAMRAEMQRMSARIDQLEGELAAAEAKADAATATATSAQAAATAAQAASAKAPAIAFKGAPEVKGDKGWTFKPRGRLQFDAGTVSSPDGTGQGDGFTSEARRIRIGASGDMPGGFGYKFEVDFAGSDVAVTDAIISYDAGGGLTVSAGQMNNFQSLEELSSSLHTSMIERAAFTDAFGFQRQVGIAAEWSGGDVLVQAGLFGDNMDNLPSKRRGVDGRLVYMPKIGKAQLHLGASAHYKDLPAGSTVRYRQRPLVHFTPDRFVDTRGLAASSEIGLGLEGAMISGPFHVAAEGFWQNANRPAGLTDPTFFGGYAEVGVFLTKGDTRGYKDGKFDRTKPRSPVGSGGTGSLQLNARYDYLDLSDAGILGGTQNGYLLSLVWKPTEYTMLLANYGRLEYDNAALAIPVGDRSYGVDAFGVRAQIDF
ncbi:porin [Altererythrobacter sp. H2]|uniref:OprO/OprP family phosphate-selective porin n=1 Tax=Altererythrobacter sp. H2 TaxID=3108391 RepID=UPI002B4C0B2B|nr:porin [Altererythrobacter sp. H2]WRK95667.1 porin [Altererythrobacter sp. H2]